MCSFSLLPSLSFPSKLHACGGGHEKRETGWDIPAQPAPRGVQYQNFPPVIFRDRSRRFVTVAVSGPVNDFSSEFSEIFSGTALRTSRVGGGGPAFSRKLHNGQPEQNFQRC